MNSGRVVFRSLDNILKYIEIIWNNASVVSVCLLSSFQDTCNRDSVVNHAVVLIGYGHSTEHNKERATRDFAACHCFLKLVESKKTTRRHHVRYWKDVNGCRGWIWNRKDGKDMSRSWWNSDETVYCAAGLLVYPQFLGRSLGRKRIYPLATSQQRPGRCWILWCRS